MKKITLVLFVLLLVISCENQTSKKKEEEINQITDNGWLKYQQKLHSLLPVGSYEVAHRITIVTTANHFPVLIITVWEEGQHNLLQMTNKYGDRGHFNSEGTRKLRSESSLTELLKCYSVELEENSGALSGVVIESNYYDHYSYSKYSYEENMSCVVKTYEFAKKNFPNFEFHIPETIQEKMKE